MSVDRQLFSSDPSWAAFRRLLLAHDGSTTRLCEAVALQPMKVLLHYQERITEAPAEVRKHLGGSHWLSRVSSLCTSEGKVLMDNLSLTRLDKVPDWFLRKLDEGQAPIGHMLQQIFVRREFVETTPLLQSWLWSHVGLPDPDTSRGYRIVTPDGPLMLIFEVFRAAIQGQLTGPALQNSTMCSSPLRLK